MSLEMPWESDSGEQSSTNSDAPDSEDNGCLCCGESFVGGRGVSAEKGSSNRSVATIGMCVKCVWKDCDSEFDEPCKRNGKTDAHGVIETIEGTKKLLVETRE